MSRRLTRFSDCLALSHSNRMLEPWHDPGYVKRAWCLFELYTSIQNRSEVEIDIILSPKQAQSFHDRINADGTDAHAIDEALAHVHSENAEASVQADLDAIRVLIQKYSGGFDTLNDTVKQYLRRWFVSQGGVKVAARVSHHHNDLVQHRHSDHVQHRQGPLIERIGGAVAAGTTSYIASQTQSSFAGGDDVTAGTVQKESTV